MATTVPTKIVLKSTTRMSLNERFSKIAPTILNIRAHMAAEQHAAAANRRLAQQYANRPGLQPSTANMYQQQPRGGGRQGNTNAAVNKSLQQRLGKSNIKNRLFMPRDQAFRGRGRGRGRGDNNPFQGDRGDNQWMASRMKGRGGFSPRGPRGRGAFRARGRGAYNRSFENFPGEDNRRYRRRRRRDYPERFNNQNTPNRQGRGARGNSRGMRRGGRGYGRGRGGGGRGGKSNVTVEELDNQLDAYMAKTKSHLDAELDAYMSETTN